jgi:membrane protease YdiL (CAAX protease family)
VPELTEPREASQKPSLAEPLVAALAVTVAVTVASVFGPEKYVATIVGFLFLLATWVLVWRKDDAFVERSGLSLGGVVVSRSVRLGLLARAFAKDAVLWALLCAVIFFVPFWIGWRWWWGAKHGFVLTLSPADAANEVLGQLVVIALPEEAFYRGYLQSRLDDVWAPKLRVLGARVGPSLLVTSAIFALGHFATIHHPSRLAVFFPSLVFGWLRARTGGVGAAILFHAMCNLFSEVLGRGYGVY